MKKIKKIILILTISFFSLLLLLIIDPFKFRENKNIKDYFEVIQEFGVNDAANNYESIQFLKNPPRFHLKYLENNKELFIINELTSKEDFYEEKIKSIRSHIFGKYFNYIFKAFIYDESLGNNYLGLEEVLLEKGYSVTIRNGSHKSEEKEELYYDDKEVSVYRYNLDGKNISLEDELQYYDGLELKDFNYLKYMDYFGYGIKLNLKIEKFKYDTPELSIEELEELVGEYLTHDRILVEVTFR